MHTRYNLLRVALTGTLSLLSTLTTADLICQSPTSLPTNTLQPGTSLTLKFTNKPASLGSALLSDVSANLICTSTADSVLTLATKLDSGKTTSATLTPAQVASALKACPANSFHVQYEEDSPLSKSTENCQGSFSLQPATKQSQNPNAEKDLAILVPPSISVPLPIPEVPTTITTTTPTTAAASATGSPSTVPTTLTGVEPQPTTIATITTTTGVPPNPSSVTTPAAGTTTLKSHPPASTTTTTRPPKSGGGGGKGSGGNNNNNDDNTPPPSPTSTHPNDLASSDMQQSTGTGPSTATIAGISIGILAGVFVILGAMLVWRKRSQRREDFDLFYGGTLAAASGFPSGSNGTDAGPGASSSAEQPIYGRSAPEEEKYEMNGGAAGPSRNVSLNAPRRSRSHTSNHNKSPMPASAPPPPLMPMHPLPTAAADQDTSYYQQQQDVYYANQQYHQQHQPQHQPQHQDYYASQHQYQQPPQRKPSYRLPRHHPAFEYENEYEHQYGQR
ncbi:hypothetical protein K457DRAFT_21055 [Linnemannia elongata AG-77]|uniref:Mid2 domain-containing protein n=1 Tax=Linnemannia elongata AG-77 TaxID=1314771 RepID=A0A197JRA8_9FUNG|nr:hypothetical protein K457DRAFT_21055 [Linnemannia elongata AG-77]